MCWSETTTVAIIGIGAVATIVSVKRKQPKAISATIAYFTLMEALQLGGYAVIDQCDARSNQTITFLSYLHIVLQPFFINAFAMEFIPEPVKARIKKWVYSLCAVSAGVMLLQLIPFESLGACQIGEPLCGIGYCTVSGDWHLAWEIPHNGLFAPGSPVFGRFPTYTLTVFLMPLLYGLWRFVVFHAVIGPILSDQLTTNPNEAPAIWCLFSVGILLIALVPPVQRFFQVHSWILWPKSWKTSDRG
jgi:hypothetical protein